MTTTLPDVPQFIGAVEGYEDYYSALKLRQRTLLAKQISLIEDNITKYSKKRSVKSKTTKVFKKILKEAKFIPADASRYVSGFDLSKVEYFVVHRPSTDTKAATLENIILTFAQFEPEKAIRSRGYCPSTHFAIGQRGELIQFVDLEDRTFHVSLAGYNEKAIGAEIEGAVGAPLSVACYTTLAKLLLQLCVLCPNLKLDAEHVLEHRNLEPQRKTDVGEPYLFTVLDSYIRLYKNSVTTAEFEEYSEEDIRRKLEDSIVELAAFGNMLAGLGKEEHKRLIAALSADTKCQSIIQSTRRDLVKSAIQLQEEQKVRLLYDANRRMQIRSNPVWPVPITNGAGVEV